MRGGLRNYASLVEGMTLELSVMDYMGLRTCNYDVESSASCADRLRFLFEGGEVGDAKLWHGVLLSDQIRDLRSWVGLSCSFVCTTLPAFTSSAVNAILLLSFAVLLNSFLQLTSHKVYNS